MKYKIVFVFVLFFLVLAQSLAYAQAGRVEVNAADIAYGYVVKKVFLQYDADPKVHVSNEEYVKAAKAPGTAYADDNPKVSIIRGMERKRPIAFIRIPAYRKGESGEWLQLKSFSFTISENPNTAIHNPLARTANASNSILANGTWYKFSVAGRGMVKLDYNFIRNQLNVDPAQINPANIRIYGNGGTMLPENNAVDRPDDLVENAVMVQAAGSGFGVNDYVVFYANGPMDWTLDTAKQLYRQIKNIYEDKSYYFITWDNGPGKRIANAGNPLTGNITVSDFNDYFVHETDLVNIGKAGKEWLGEEFSILPGKSNTQSFSFNVGNLTENAKIRTVVYARNVNVGNNVFQINLNGQQIFNRALGSITGDDESAQATYRDTTFDLPVNGTVANLNYTFTPGSSAGAGYLGYILFNTRRRLEFSSGQLNFRDLRSVAAGNVAQYQLSNANAAIQVWNVSNPLEPVKINNTQLSGGTLSFAYDAGKLEDFIAWDGSGFVSPAAEGKVDNQNLHGLGQVDYIIITSKELLPAAQALADFHRQANGYRVAVVSREQVYNEFSSGGQDISALRDFVRMFYKRASNEADIPRYLLLFGAASHDYKNRLANNTNVVPTFESAESITGISSFCSDDFFGFLDDNENAEDYSIVNTLDVGVGRIPARNLQEALAIVEKIKRYKSPEAFGPWRISNLIATDNRDRAGDHFDDGEYMADVMNTPIRNLYNTTKVHLDATSYVSTPGGDRAPEANKTINDAVYKGVFLINYSGHGNINTLSGKRIITSDDFNNWKNAYKLPVMVTATCDFSRFDDPAYIAAGVKIMMKEDGGAIALLTTTQLVYRDQNREINRDYLNAQFTRTEDGYLTFGEAYRRGKNINYVIADNKTNHRKFALLGDPALMPNFPKHVAQTDSIIDLATNTTADTLKALGAYKIAGSVKDIHNNPLSDFNGTAYVTVYDKPKLVNTFIGSPQRTFSVQNNIVYNGKVSVQDGKFSVVFVTPKDINYAYGEAKISYYFHNDETDGAGIDSNIVVGGYSDNPIESTLAPVVKPYMNDTLFIDGGITGSSTLLYVKLQSETGINVTGSSIGHDITAVLDGDYSNPYILNDYYEAAHNDYRNGVVKFPISGLSDGLHNFEVKAWDVNNNSAIGKVRFVVVNGEVVKVENLMNFPNPFTDKTYFVFEHNHPEEKLEGRILIYNMQGQLVRTLELPFTPNGSRSADISWDGTDNNGNKVQSGVYAYKVNLVNSKGISGTAYQKLVFIR